MAENVTYLPVATETLGQHLRKLAQRADLGEFQSGSMSFVSPQNTVLTSWWLHPDKRDSFAVIGAMMVLQHEFTELVREPK